MESASSSKAHKIQEGGELGGLRKIPEENKAS